MDIGTTAAVVAAGFNGKLTLGVYPQFGLGDNLPGLLQYTQLEDIMRWLPLDIAPGVVRDYLYQRSLYPGTIPATKEDHAIGHAISRQALYLAMQEARRNFPPEARLIKKDLMPLFEPILAGGGALSDAPTPGTKLAAFTGCTATGWDHLDHPGPKQLASVIGSGCRIQPVTACTSVGIRRVHEPGNHRICHQLQPVTAHPVLKARLTYEDGSDTHVEVKFGGLEILPLGMGQTARLTLQPLQRSDIGNGPGRNATVQVAGGVMGVVIDARGRPLTLPEDPVRRRELFKKWLWSVGG